MRQFLDFSLFLIVEPEPENSSLIKTVFQERRSFFIDEMGRGCGLGRGLGLGRGHG